MTMRRYYKLKDFTTKPGFDLELSELQFKGLNAAALTFTLTANQSPKTGSLAALTDGSLSSVCSFEKRTLDGLELTLDFTTAPVNTLNAVVLGSGTSQNTFPYTYTLQYSTNATAWTDVMKTFDHYGPRKLQYVAANSLQDAASMDKAYSSFNFNSFDPTLYSVSQQPDKTYKVVCPLSIGSASHRSIRPLNCKPLRAGKWYFEIRSPQKEVGQPTYFLAGVTGTPEQVSPTVDNTWPGSGISTTVPNTGVGFSGNLATTWRNGNNIDYYDLRLEEDFHLPIGICIDIDNLKVTLYHKNVMLTTTATAIRVSSTTEYYPAVGFYLTGWQETFFINTGLAPFANTVPAGFTPLCDYVASTFPYEKTVTDYDRTNSIVAPLEQRSFPSVDTFVKNIKGPLSVRATDVGRNIGYVKGNVFVGSTPAIYLRRYVTLMDVMSGKIVDTSFSNAATGEYVFLNLNISKKYVAWTYDPTNVLLPTISSVMTPVKMPIFN